MHPLQDGSAATIAPFRKIIIPITDCDFDTISKTYFTGCRYDHQKMHELHRGHESMHTTMVMILIVVLIVAQVVVVEWKKRHYKSYAVS